jgi:hypothetical protein
MTAGVTALRQPMTVRAAAWEVAVPGPDWIPLLQSCGYSPAGEVNGYQVLTFGTVHGDALYRDQEGCACGVDAGLIGLVPEAAFEPEAPRRATMPFLLGQIVTFTHEAIARTHGPGHLEFGRYRINTASDDQNR